ncbi:MAG TPA: MFS transporter, partial [Rhodobacteraceae bacterium]|nr:MFS transporter [Paracoccaceae bacterium]
MIQHDRKYSWFRLSVTLAIATIGNVGMWLIIVVMPAIQSEFHIDRADAALPYTLTMIGFAFGNFIIGGFVDRFGIVRVLIAAAVLNAIGLAGAASAPSIAVISGCQFLIGLGNAATFGPLIADVSHWFLKRRGIAVALAASGNYFSGALWPWVLKDVIELQGWRSTYVVLAGLSLAI